MKNKNSKILLNCCFITVYRLFKQLNNELTPICLLTNYIFIIVTLFVINNRFTNLLISKIKIGKYKILN